jgi:hypothetical protein
MLSAVPVGVFTMRGWRTRTDAEKIEGVFGGISLAILIQPAQDHKKEPHPSESFVIAVDHYLYPYSYSIMGWS